MLCDVSKFQRSAVVWSSQRIQFCLFAFFFRPNEVPSLIKQKVKSRISFHPFKYTKTRQKSKQSLWAREREHTHTDTLQVKTIFVIRLDFQEHFQIDSDFARKPLET